MNKSDNKYIACVVVTWTLFTFGFVDLSSRLSELKTDIRQLQNHLMDRSQSSSMYNPLDDKRLQKMVWLMEYNPHPLGTEDGALADDAIANHRKEFNGKVFHLFSVASLKDGSGGVTRIFTEKPMREGS